VRDSPPDPEFKSADRLEFEIYLRTGRRLARAEAPERKFNPYHDPRNGQFTFAPGGARSVGGLRVSGGLRKRTQALAFEGSAKPVDAASGIVAGERNPARSTAVDARAAAQVLNNSRPNSRARMGGNGGPPLDPLIMTQAIPGLQNSLPGAIVAVPAGFLDLTGPASDAIGGLHEALAKSLIKQIQAIDPKYHHYSLGPPQTFEGRVNEINRLRFDRAVALLKIRHDPRALQVEVLRVMQNRADSAYDEAVELHKAGRLPARLSREEAIGNFIDRAVKTELRQRFNWHGINYAAGQPVRVVGREYDSSGTDLTYRVPDARVFNVAYDVTLTRKTLATPQVRGYFNSDFQPDSTIIIRPRQLGAGSTYVITSPRRQHVP
jgi:hypothetical protein